MQLTDGKLYRNEVANVGLKEFYLGFSDGGHLHIITSIDNDDVLVEIVGLPSSFAARFKHEIIRITEAHPEKGFVFLLSDESELAVALHYQAFD